MHDQAMVSFEKITADSELYASARINIGMILKQENRREEAVQTIREAILRKKDTPGFYLFLSSLQEGNGDLPAAKKTLEEGLLVSPENVDLHYNLGVLYEKTNHFQESIKEMEIVLKNNPDHADALNFIGYLYADQGINLEHAEIMLKKALQLKPDNGYVMDSMGWLYFRQNRMDLAIKYLKDALNALPDDATIAEHLGDAYVKTGRTREAIEHYERALKANSSDVVKKKLEQLQMNKNELPRPQRGSSR
jgi:tetratricopeptide (TPR) repeat protein